MIRFFFFCFYFIHFSFALKQSTSQGLLAAEIEAIGEQTADFSNQASDAFKSLNKKFESEQNFTSSTSEALISSKITELETEYARVEAKLQPLRDLYVKESKNCKEHLSCDTCKTSKSCVWCTVEEKCVNGDEQGPTEGDCSDYLYQECSYPGCEEYQDCESCISDPVCGWCSIGHSCYESTSIEIGDCDFEYFYHSEGNTSCPAYQAKVSTYSDNTDEVLLSEIQSLESILQDISSEIEYLKDCKSEIVRKASDKIEVESAPELSSYEGISNQTDDQAVKEKQAQEEWQGKLWSQWSTDVNAEINDDIQREFGEVIDEINKYME